MMWPGFVGPSYTAGNPHAANERTMNFYVEHLDKAEAPKARKVLMPTPGVALFATPTPVGQALIRGLFAHRGRCWAVAGGNFQELLSSGSVVTRGSIAHTDQVPVTSMTTNGDGGRQILTTSNNQAFIYDMDTHVITRVRITGTNTMAAYLDSRFIMLDASTSTIYFSETADRVDVGRSEVCAARAGG